MATARAHSSRLQNSSQPSLYTPLTDPVAWYALAAHPPEQYNLAQQSAHSLRAYTLHDANSS